MTHIIGIGECQVSKDALDTLITHALGSCIAVVIHDPTAKVAGILHFMLPDSTLDLQKAALRPFVYADTGIPRLFREAYRLGASKSTLRVMATGGAQMLGPTNTFDIGKRNLLATEQILNKAGVSVDKEDTGGTLSRTVSIDVFTGLVRLRTSGLPDRLLLIQPPVERRQTPRSERWDPAAT